MSAFMTCRLLWIPLRPPLLASGGTFDIGFRIHRMEVWLSTLLLFFCNCIDSTSDLISSISYSHKGAGWGSRPWLLQLDGFELSY